MKPLVYLAGPITGLTFDDGQSWRDYATKSLEPDIKAISPLRGKEYLKGVGIISATGEDYAHLGTLSLPKGVMARDYYDTERCDLVLAVLHGAKQVSIGTVMEIGWAWQLRKPLIVVMEDKGNWHEHMMVNEATSYRVRELDEALDLVQVVLG